MIRPRVLRTSPSQTKSYRETVLTDADTVLQAPDGYFVARTVVVNDGTGRLYVHPGPGAVNTAEDFFLEANEQVVLTPLWASFSMRAEGAECVVRILAEY